MQDVGVMAKRAGNYAIDMHITDAPVPTESATIDHHDKRDIRTQKPKLGTAGTLTIKNLDYPGSGKLFGGSKPARHAFQFNDNSIKDARVKDLGKAPTNTVDFATEHIVEVRLPLSSQGYQSLILPAANTRRFPGNSCEEEQCTSKIPLG
jgi:hypothetical protein